MTFKEQLEKVKSELVGLFAMLPALHERIAEARESGDLESLQDAVSQRKTVLSQIDFLSEKRLPNLMPAVHNERKAEIPGKIQKLADKRDKLKADLHQETKEGAVDFLRDLILLGAKRGGGALVLPDGFGKYLLDAEKSARDSTIGKLSSEINALKSELAGLNLHGEARRHFGDTWREAQKKHGLDMQTHYIDARYDSR